MTSSPSKPAYTKSSFDRARWNVMDIITIIASKAVPTHIISDFNMEAAEKLRAKLSTKERKVTVTAIILKAISIAQLSHPESRAYRLPLGMIVQRPKPVAGFTVERMVGKREQAAVFFGNINDAHTKSLADIAKELNAYGTADLMKVPQLAKEHVLSFFPWILRQLYVAVGVHTPPLRKIINPATFGMSSLGKFNLNVLVAPNVTTCIFGVGTVEPRVVVVDNEIITQKMMTVAFSFDTLTLDMGKGAHLLATIQDLIESGLQGHLTEEEIEQVKLAEIASKKDSATTVAAGGSESADSIQDLDRDYQHARDFISGHAPSRMALRQTRSLPPISEEQVREVQEVAAQNSVEEDGDAA